MTVREGFLEEATSDEGLQRARENILGRRHSRRLRQVAVWPHVPEPGFLMEIRAGVRVQQGGALVLSADRLLLQLLFLFQLSRGCHTCLLGWRVGGQG